MKLEKYSAYLSWELAGVTIDPAAPREEQLRSLAANRFAIGSPAQVVDALLRQYRAGVTHATMRVSWPGMTQTDILAGIELLGRDRGRPRRQGLRAPRILPRDEPPGALQAAAHGLGVVPAPFVLFPDSAVHVTRSCVMAHEPRMRRLLRRRGRRPEDLPERSGGRASLLLTIL